MACHNYDDKIEKVPAPILDEVRVSKPVLKPDDTEVYKIKCKLDSGAYKTVIPQGVINELKLRSSGNELVEDFNGNVSKLPVYPVKLSLPGYDQFFTDVIPTKGEIGLMGRDILNKYVLILDGVNLKFCLWDNCECKFVSDRCRDIRVFMRDS